ncbi:MAG TPA: hypothetical protein VGR62_17605 [Candidatus Binatia bacterium]|jgi:hypothetical protein|nr:hypothetical protein [Candidatus Binatia bacterium]
MSNVPVAALIDGVMQTLREAVLPDVKTRFARGQVFAVLDVLNNLRDRIAPSPELMQAEIDSATMALTQVIAALHLPAAQPVHAALAAAPVLPLADRVAALRAALVVALDATAAHPDARAPVLAHLSAQAMRDVMVLKPSLLQEISKG